MGRLLTYTVQPRDKQKRYYWRFILHREFWLRVPAWLVRLLRG